MGKHTKRMPGCLPRVAAGAAPLALLLAGPAGALAETRPGPALSPGFGTYDETAPLPEPPVYLSPWIGDLSPSAQTRDDPLPGEAERSPDTGRFTGDLAGAASADPTAGRFTGTLIEDRHVVSGDLGLFDPDPAGSFGGQFTLDELAVALDHQLDPVPHQLGYQLDDSRAVSQIGPG